MVLAAVSLLERNPHPSDDDIRDGLAGNLCRCTGYMRIFEAVLDACRERRRSVRSLLSRLRAARAADLDRGLRRCSRDEPGAWRPFAGGTDLMVLFEAGKLPPGKYVSLWGLRRAPRHRGHAEIVTLGALTTYTDVLRASGAASGIPTAVPRPPQDRRRRDTEPRHARRQHRQRVAGGRHASRAARLRRGARA